jgi:hypothetical protein
MTKPKVSRANYHKLIRRRGSKVTISLRDCGGEGVELNFSTDGDEHRFDNYIYLPNRIALDLSEALHELASAWSGPRNSQPPTPPEDETELMGR